MLSKISFGKRSNRHSECVPQAIRIVILSRADGEGSLIARECISRLRAPSSSARFGMTRQRLARSANSWVEGEDFPASRFPNEMRANGGGNNFLRNRD